jgi:nucleotide-binding universal stress UspA family protein
VRVSEIVLPHDLTPLSDRALEAVASLDIAPSRVHVLHVVARVDPNLPRDAWQREEDDPRCALASRSLRHRLADGPWSRAEVHVRIGDPGIQIVALASEVRADLVAMPSHGRRGLERFLFGSVAEHVVRFAPCPVLVLPALTLQGRVAPDRQHPAPEVDERIDALAVQVCDLIACQPGFLTALRLGIPAGEDPGQWEEALGQRLATTGIEFVDMAFTPIDDATPRILSYRFEPLPDE